MDILRFTLALLFLSLPNSLWATEQPLTSSAFEVKSSTNSAFELKLAKTIDSENLQLANFEIIRGFSKRFLSAPDSLNYSTSRWKVSTTQLLKGWTDSHMADGITYVYLVRSLDSKKNHSFVFQWTTAPRSLSDLKEPLLVIDKTLHTLEVYDQGELIKTYAAAFGADPVSRKLFQDNKTTPEGVYQIIGRQKQAQFYRAYDLNYPNVEDKKRWQEARNAGQISPTAAIGGEIQIHGKDTILFTNEIELNWTYGCIALRNADLDELFSQLSINTDTQVIILGAEVKREDFPTLN